MPHFPMCVDLSGRPVLLVGSGAQIREKAQRLAPFGARLIRVEQLTEAHLAMQPAFVVAGDLPAQEAHQAAALCALHGVPINVVDQPQLCTFTFPALVMRGELTIALATGGKAPAAAAWLKAQIAQNLPERTEALLEWLSDMRVQLRQTHPACDCSRLMREITAAAFAKGDVLTREEWQRITEQNE